MVRSYKDFYDYVNKIHRFLIQSVDFRVLLINSCDYGPVMS